jgi:AraC family ethanolamine operon transcriptional activator
MSGLVVSRNVVSFEDLSAVVMGADLKTTQLDPGQCRGQLLHADLGAMQVSAGRFETENDIRMRGVLSTDRVVLAMILSPSGQISQWQQEALQGDIFVFPRNFEQDGRFAGSTSYVTIDMTVDELAAAGAQFHLDESKYWEHTVRYRAAPDIRYAATRRLGSSIAQLQQADTPLSESLQAHLKEQFLNAFLVQASDSVHGGRYIPPVRNGMELVRRVEDYVRAHSDVPVDIQTICNELAVSRSTLQRAFNDTLDRPPKLALQRLRLSQVHAVLRTADPQSTTIRQIAYAHGFYELGRFAGAYRRLFGESPSATLQRPRGIARFTNTAPDWRHLMALDTVDA